MCKILPNPDNDLVQHNIESVNCILGDLSSAWNEYSARNLYATGPSKNEITEEYAPPEVLLQHQASWSPFSVQNPYSYDSWSIGVVVRLYQLILLLFHISLCIYCNFLLTTI